MNNKMTSLFHSELSELLANITNSNAVRTPQRLVVALSGGVDSVVLLYLLSTFRKAHPQYIVLAHNVNHGLSENAQHWAEFCQTLCKQLDIALINSKVTIESKPRKSLEALARDARYNCFQQAMKLGDVILTGHHQDDQLETLLLALKRGSGSTGLQGIRPVQSFHNGHLLRPLLNFSRQQILDYAIEHELKWIEDESNLDTRFDRNFIRQKISPLLTERWPAIAQSVSRTALLCQEQQSLLEEVAGQDLAICESIHLNQQVLMVAKLLEFSAARRNNVLRFWLKTNGLEYPSNKQLKVLWEEVALASSDKQPKLILGAYSVRRYQESLYIVNEEDMILPKQPIFWSGEPLLELIQGRISVDFSKVDSLIAEQYEITCCFRHHLDSNLTCLPEERNKARSIKKLLHEYQVPPWYRDYIVFILVDQQIVQAVGVWRCQVDSLPSLNLLVHQNAG